jgi:transcriptional regulator with XRE-family HTH domain
MAELELGHEVGAGPLALDPPPDAADGDNTDESRLALGRFVSLARRRHRLSMEALAEKANVDVGELFSIERDVHHLPETRTLYQLATVFGVSQRKLMGLSGLTKQKDVRYVDEAIRYAARSESISRLTKEEEAALDGLIAVLSERRE